MAENNTYFTSSGITKGSNCKFKICKSQSNVCQLRLDFETFVLNLVSIILTFFCKENFKQVCFSRSHWPREMLMDQTQEMAILPLVCTHIIVLLLLLLLLLLQAAPATLTPSVSRPPVVTPSRPSAGRTRGSTCTCRPAIGATRSVQT